MAPAHQAKRPYAGSQPPITSYFTQSPSTTSPRTTYSVSQLPHDSTSELRPSLPPSIQANLLSVGMRVRKSVPEGYKTGSYSAFTLFSDPTPTPERNPVKKITPRPRTRELAPFCGIMKVGGLAQQQSGAYDEGDSSAIDLDYDDEDEVPPLSQGSTNSDVSVDAPVVNKRRFDLDEEEEQVDDVRDAVTVLGQRVMAVPRRRGASKFGAGLAIVGQENSDADMDFEEATFLDYDLLPEVEMGGA
ncbi:hypothetical protein M430DRAFT_36628 [Amorphotheca resinae ATCC 22711]|uniref:Uncharacterized protein n=1 Tax=Amorphotheca resinae ATCC 22711 TaxID=857342 RepID=A0A2T3AV28_AMORE|nr:hypothetical protein M430DRAFT_36628 [Amorphotheca resinae ATCC 22711]PSS12525.1 hypothetical protein M430DRAFT_36628 [Amorphotheca resinae ATCC 22711]